MINEYSSHLSAKLLELAYCERIVKDPKANTIQGVSTVNPTHQTSYMKTIKKRKKKNAATDPRQKK